MNLELTIHDYAYIKQNAPHSSAAKYIADSAAGTPMPWIDMRIAKIALEIFLNAIFIPVCAFSATQIYFLNKAASCFKIKPVENEMTSSLKKSLRFTKLCLYVYFRGTKTAAEFKKIEDHNKSILFLNKLPKEIQYHILNYVDSPTLEIVPTICRDFKDLLDAPEGIAIRLANIEETRSFKNDDLKQFLALADKAGRHVKEFNLGPEPKMDGKTLAQIIKSCPNIEKLSFDLNLFDSEPWALFKELKHLRQLKIGDLYTTQPEDIQHLGDCTQLTHLEFVKTSRTPGLSGDSFQPLSKLTNLMYLNVSNMKSFADNALKHISGLKNLKYLDISGCAKVTDNGFSYLSKMKQLRHLFAFDSRYIPPEDWLDITDTGLSYLTDLVNLESFSISNSKMTDKGLNYLSNLFQLSYLRLSMGKFTDESLKHLGKMTTLKKLDLKYNAGITDARLPDLYTLVNLREILLPKTISEKAVEAFVKKFPPDSRIKCYYDNGSFYTFYRL